MDELTILFLVLAVVLAIVTVVGHGIWVLLSKIFGGGGNAAPSLHPKMRGDGLECPRCHSPLGRDQQECDICFWPYASQQPLDGAAAIRILRRQVEVLSQQGALDADARGQLSTIIAQQEQRLTQQARATQPQPDVARPMPTDPQFAESELLTPIAEPAPLAPVAQPAAAPSRLSPGERVRQYSASRSAAMSEPPAESAASGELPKQREALSRLFAAFMEEKNIRWGELVGGLLIVGCSIALVISLWSRIASQPLLKFALFNGVTAALFGVGIYTDRRWKIHTTSHGILVISALLVPLNFLAIAAFTQASPPTDFLSLAGEGISLVVFALLVYLAGRILVPLDAVLLAAGVMIPSLMQLLVRRFAGPTAPLNTLYALAVPPVISYLATVMAVVNRRWAVGAPAASNIESNVDACFPEVEANRVLMFLGVVSAATIMPLALLLHYVRPMHETLHWLAPLGTVCGLPALLVGLLFWRRIYDRARSGLQTAGIAVGALGTLVMVGSIVLAWPDPATLLPTTIVTALVMTAVALWFGIPAAHVPGGVAIAIACLIGFYLVRGDLSWTLADSGPIKSALLSVTSGHALVPIVAVLGCSAWLLRRFGRREDSLMYALVTAATAAASLGLVIDYGFARMGDPANATWTLAIYTIGAIATAVVLERTDAARIGSALLLATLVQAIVYRFNPVWQLERPWIVALLTHATTISLGCFALIYARNRLRARSAGASERAAEAIRSFAYSELVTSIAAAAWIAATSGATSAGALAVYLAWLAGVWLLLAVLAKSAELFSAAQVAALFAVLCGVTAAAKTHAWYAASPHPWLDPWYLETQGIALAAYCLAFTGLRWVFSNWSGRENDRGEASLQPGWVSIGDTLLNPSWPAVDHLVSIAVAAMMAVVALYAVMPGAAQELSPTAVVGQRATTPIEQFEIASIPHIHAFDRGAWLLLAAVAISSSAGLWKRRGDWRRIELVFAAMVMCLLLAAQWESQVAVASALRWLSAGFFAAASAVTWIVQRSPSADMRPKRKFRDLLVAFVILVYVAMGVYVGQSSLMRTGMGANITEWWPWVAVWAVLAGVAAVATPYLVTSERDHPTNHSDASTNSWALHARGLMLLLAAAPAAILLTFAIAKALDQQPIVGPDQTSWFHRVGDEVSYGVPLVVIALTFIGYAIRDRSAPFAFAAGLLFNVVATIVVLLRLARGSGALDAAAWIDVAQVNAIMAGFVALVWQSALGWHRRNLDVSRGEAKQHAPLLLITQVALAAALCCAFLIPAVLNVATKNSPAAWAAAANGALGWSAVAFAVAASLWLHWPRSVSQNAVTLFAAALSALLTLTAASNYPVGWPAYHTLLASCCVAAWLVPLATPTANRWLIRTRDLLPAMRWSAPAVRLFAVTGVFLSLWGYDGSPATLWWTVAALVAISVRNVWMAWRETGRGAVWIAAVLFNIAMSILWMQRGRKLTATRGLGELFELLWVNVLAAAVMAVISVWIERRWFAAESGSTSQQTGAPTGRRSPIGIAFHRFAAWAIVTLLLVMTGAGLAADLMGESFAASQALAWAAWSAAAIVAIACLWDSRIRWPVACLYCVGLVAVGMYLDRLNLRAPKFLWALANALAAYSLATSALWSARERLQVIANRLGAPTWSSLTETANSEFRRNSATWEGSGHGWLVPANLLIGVGVLLLVSWIEVSMESFTQRMVAAYAVVAQAFALGLLARGAVRTSLQYLALVWGVLFAVAFSWAWLPPDFPAIWLHRLVVTVAALVVVVVVYGFGLVKFLRRENEWTRAAARLVPALAALAVALILVVLGMEVTAYARTGSVPIEPATMIAVGLALASLSAAALVAALVPGRDPLGLSERGRTLYVYAAEGLAALLFLHIRVTMPWLFRGWFLRFWPLVVMAVAFVGVGLAEVFQRRRQRVLSEPLETTGALLPILPALGFWVMSSEVNYSLLLLSIGVLYAGLSVLRGSFLYGVLAALAANGSLWYFLHQQEGLDLTKHPQLWLIPPALCALAAGYINRERLSAQQSAALRYASAIVIYVSSTADVFIIGVADAPWLPAVLAGVSIIGVLAGILLRVRAFLYLGTAFLVVALMTIIWHAAIEQQRTWILWVAGILTGALIFALFGLFEKRRDDVLRVVEELKHWEA